MSLGLIVTPTRRRSRRYHATGAQSRVSRSGGHTAAAAGLTTGTGSMPAMLFDLPLDRLREYRPPRSEPADFDAFWRDTLAQAQQHPLAARFEPYDVGLSTVETYDVTFAGYGGQPIRGWLLLPAQRS